MFYERVAKPKEYFLKKGYIYVPDHPTLISTVLGSGVSVCLWDSSRRKGGMNYFLYPEAKKPSEARSIYGNVSTVALVKFFLEDGSSIEHLEAQIFGGAFPLDGDDEIKAIARQNIAIARKVIGRYGIPVVAEDVGGHKGRKIVFNTYTSEIAIIHVEKIRAGDWYPYESER